MITQTIRILTNTSYSGITIGNVSNIFPKLELNELSTVPSEVTFDTAPGYIQAMDISAITYVTTFYLYLTLGGSPPTEDAMLIIEVVDSLTDESDTCAKSQTILVDSINNRDGYARINSLYDFDSMPKVGEYVYIDSTVYSGYTMIKNVISTANIVIDIPYSVSLSPVNCYVTYFGANTSKCIVWINREGGRSSYTFDQRKDYNGIVGENKTFDNNGTVKYFNRGKNFDYITVYKTGLSDTEADLIESLRYCIQAWEYDINTNISTPITVDSNSYSKYSTKNKMNEINLKYRIATYKLIQNQ
jgi:hypothetical protein